MAKTSQSNRLLPERLAAKLWRNRQNVRLRTLDGKNLRVLYPGRPNGGPGPDFKDALVKPENAAPVRGDIEVHRATAGWKTHGHQHDPRYNNVALHLVYGEDAPGPVYREDGQMVPAVPMPLGDTPEEAGPSWLAQRLHPWRAMPVVERQEALERLGEARFLLKRAVFRLALAQQGPDQVMYQGVMEALGYSRNRAPFLELASCMPWQAIRQEATQAATGQGAAVLEGLLLAAGGLGQGEPPKGVRRMPPAAWRLAGLRPQNHPRRRIAGAAVLFARAIEMGPTVYFVRLAKAGEGTAFFHGLEASRDGQTLIGRDRALDTAVNIVLPCLHAWAGVTGDDGLAAACLRIYRICPKSADNELLREIAFLLDVPASHLARNASQQQGALHLYETLLQEGDAHIYGAPSPEPQAFHEGLFPYTFAGRAALGETSSLSREVSPKAPSQAWEKAA